MGKTDQDYQGSLPELIVRQANEIVHGRWETEKSLVWESRILAYMATKGLEHEGEKGVFEIPVEDLVRNTSGERLGGAGYEQVRMALDNMHEKKIYVDYYSEATKNWYTDAVMSIFSLSAISKNKKYIILHMTPIARDLFFNSENFTEYRIDCICNFATFHEHRLFEYLSSLEREEVYNVELSKVYDILCVPKSYRRPYLFQKNVLKSAKRNFANRLNFHFNYSLIKKGRAYHSVSFKVLKRGNKSMEANPKTQDAEISTEEKHRVLAENGSEKMTKPTLVYKDEVPQKIVDYIELRVELYASNEEKLRKYLIDSYKKGTLKIDDFDKLKEIKNTRLLIDRIEREIVEGKINPLPKFDRNTYSILIDNYLSKYYGASLIPKRVLEVLPTYIDEESFNRLLKIKKSRVAKGKYDTRTDFPEFDAFYPLLIQELHCKMKENEAKKELLSPLGSLENTNKMYLAENVGRGPLLPREYSSVSVQHNTKEDQIQKNEKNLRKLSEGKSASDLFNPYGGEGDGPKE